MSNLIQKKVSQVDQLVLPIRDTLRGVLKDPTINEAFGGKNQSLNSAQCGLASAVVAKMQDRLLEEKEKAHARELGLVAGFWKLYQTRVIATTTAQSIPKGLSEPLPAKSYLGGLFTWGNLIGGAAIILVAMSFYYTKVTANYEQNWRGAEEQIVKLNGELASNMKLNEELEGQLAKERARADASETALKDATGNAQELQKTLLEAIQALGQQRAELARQTAGSSTERKFQSLYEGCADETNKLRDQVATLKEKRARLEEKLKAARKK